MASAPVQTDIAIIGVGIAGASLAAEIGDAARVVLIEAEDQPGYHATGRSAAFWSETYGGPAIQPLTTASEAWLRGGGFLFTRGCLHLASRTGGPALAALAEEFTDSPVQLEHIPRDRVDRLIPGVRAGHGDAIFEPSCADIDVAALHADYLARARKSGAILRRDSRVTSLQPIDGGWRVETSSGPIVARHVVNAAGAWAAGIGVMARATPIGIAPFRRTVVQLLVDPPVSADMPMVIDAEERFYWKPEAGGRVWVSPHDETPTPPCDTAPEELDIAIAIDRFERAVEWRIVKRERAWAGLRSFAPDRIPVYGFDPKAPGFFWFAGQGGFGIQTAPAAAMIGAALLLGRELPEVVADIDVGRYAPARFG